MDSLALRGHGRSRTQQQLPPDHVGAWPHTSSPRAMRGELLPLRAPVEFCAAAGVAEANVSTGEGRRAEDSRLGAASGQCQAEAGEWAALPWTDVTAWSSDDGAERMGKATGG